MTIFPPGHLLMCNQIHSIMKTSFLSPLKWILMGLVLTASGNFLQGKTLSPRISNYTMSVTLHPQTKIIDGHMILDWRNPSRDTIHELQFHMYLNAFKNTESTFWKESGGQLRGIRVKGNNRLIWGWVDIKKMETGTGTDLTGDLRFIQPDDQNEKDQTVVAVSLNKPVMPGGSIRLVIDFQSKLPKIFARTGYSNDYFLVGQWFPKIGVYEPAGMRYAEKGQWNCHQFHANSEFYANFSVYKVDITLPKEYIVGAVGELKEEKLNADSTKTCRYVARDVVDFAWTASPHFKIAEDQWKNVKIKVLLQPEHFSQASRHTESAKVALDFFNAHLGPYPYNTLTIIDPPLGGSGSGGMEYPTFITAGCIWKMPEEIRLTEMVTIHEFGHDYFMGILATNEFEEAWMDEGFNTWFETRIMDETYGEKTSFVGFKKFHFGDLESQRLGYTTMRNPKIAEVFRPAWGYPQGGYGSMSYNKTTTWMETLQRIVGDQTMEKIMKTYFNRWKFKHPCGRDFIAIVNEVVTKEHGLKFGPDMNWFFDAVLYSSDVCDYRVSSITSKKVRPPKGVYEEAGNKMTYKTIKYENTIYESKVNIERPGEVIMPQEVLIHFSNGEEITENWDGRSRTRQFIYKKPEKVEWARIDPENKILVDINLQNNSRMTKPPKTVFWKYALKYLFALQNMMLNLSFFS